jgi:hypothetical protein
MAISGKFLADFESFYTACSKAEISLRKIESGAGTVQTSLNKMADRFSGREIVQQATLMAQVLEQAGGAASFTATELAKMGAVGTEAAEKLRVLGKDVPAGIQKIAQYSKEADTAQAALGRTVKEVALGFAGLFTLHAAADFVKNVIDQASALKHLSQQTQINVVDLQVLGGATRTFGIDSDTLGKGLYTLARNIAGGDASVVTGLHLMGLSLKEVEGLHGKELFLKVMDGLSTLQGGLRDTAASDVFGSRIGAALAGASQGMRTAVEDAERLNSVMSKESVDAIDEYDTAIKRAQTSLSAMAANMIGPVAQGFNVLTDAVGRGASKWAIFKAVILDAGPFALFSTNAEHLATVLDHLNLQAEADAAATKRSAAAHTDAAAALTAHQQAARFMATLEADASAKLDAGQLKNLAHLKEIGALNAANAAAIGVNAVQFAKYTEEQIGRHRVAGHAGHDQRNDAGGGSRVSRGGRLASGAGDGVQPHGCTGEIRHALHGRAIGPAEKERRGDSHDDAALGRLRLHAGRTWRIRHGSTDRADRSVGGRSHRANAEGWNRHRRVLRCAGRGDGGKTERHSRRLEGVDGRGNERLQGRSATDCRQSRRDIRGRPDARWGMVGRNDPEIPRHRRGGTESGRRLGPGVRRRADLASPEQRRGGISRRDQRRIYRDVQ